MEVPKKAIYFLVGNNDKYMPIGWQYKFIRRVIKSTLAAETWAMVDLAEACIFYRKFLLEILQLKDNSDNIKIFCKTDKCCLYDLVHASTQILDKRLCIEIAISREMIERKEIAEISWIATDVKIADSLTKKGVPSLGSYQGLKNHLYNVNKLFIFFCRKYDTPLKRKRKRGRTINGVIPLECSPGGKAASNQKLWDRHNCKYSSRLEDKYSLSIYWLLLWFCNKYCAQLFSNHHWV